MQFFLNLLSHIWPHETLCISSAFHHITAAAHTTTVYVCKYLYRGGVQCVKVLSSFPLMAYNLSLNYLLLNAIKSKSRKM